MIYDAKATTPAYCQREAVSLEAVDALRADERSRQSLLLRDIFSPFGPARVDPAWLVWSDGIATQIAQAIYKDRAFDRLPVLADALEDAGCDDPAILDHCRSVGIHARGCWVVDLVLGKE
jgi:hypothetical protein